MFSKHDRTLGQRVDGHREASVVRSRAGWSEANFTLDIGFEKEFSSQPMPKSEKLPCPHKLLRLSFPKNLSWTCSIPAQTVLITRHPLLEKSHHFLFLCVIFGDNTELQLTSIYFGLCLRHVSPFSWLFCDIAVFEMVHFLLLSITYLFLYFQKWDSCSLGSYYLTRPHNVCEITLQTNKRTTRNVHWY